MIELLNSELLDNPDKYLVFGVVLFTEAHPHVIKALKDTEYWNALDVLSGEHLPVFATRLFKGEYGFPNLPPGYAGMMVPVWKEPRQNKEYLSWFLIDDSNKLPLFVVFGVKGSTIYYAKYPIKTDSPVTVFASLEEPIKMIVNQVKNVGEIEDYDKFYRALNFKMNVLKAKNLLGRILQLTANLRGVTGV